MSLAGRRSFVYAAAMGATHDRTRIALFAFGSSERPRGPRETDFLLPDRSQCVGPEEPPRPNGASAFADPELAPLSGHYHELPAGTLLPDGLALVRDDADAVPGSTHRPGHHTIYPTRQMPLEEFARLFGNLPWRYKGKKRFA